MTKKLYSLFVFTLLILTTLCAEANNRVAGIEVSGEGSITVVPDDFSLSLTITERGRLTSKLKVLVDRKSNAVIEAAKKLGIKNGSISSAQVNLRIVEEKPSITVQGIELKKGFPQSNKGSVYIDGQDMTNQVNDRNLVKPKSPLFELSRRIVINFNHIDQYDLFLTKIVKINVSHISSLSMSVLKREEYYQQALLLAITQAKNKAKKMIEHSGGRLGKLIHLKEQSNAHYQPRFSQAMMSDSSSNSHRSLIGSQTIKASVLMRFSVVE
jgi:uncharacterized protein YggE